ncbi:MAG: nucleotide exchange factor GrpE [Flavobacteriales bacterium]
MNKEEISNESTAEVNEQDLQENQAEQSADQENAAEDWQAKYFEMNDKFLRLYSEFDNFKKRNARERIELVKTAGEDIIKSVLPILDDFERALKAMHNAGENDAVKEGVDLIFNKLKNALHAKGLQAMESLGQEFNPDLHEAITNIPAADESMKGKIVDEVERGYLLNDKVIRYAKVIVGS